MLRFRPIMFLLLLTMINLYFSTCHRDESCEGYIEWPAHYVHITEVCDSDEGASCCNDYYLIVSNLAYESYLLDVEPEVERCVDYIVDDYNTDGRLIAFYPDAGCSLEDRRVRVRITDYLGVSSGEEHFFTIPDICND